MRRDGGQGGRGRLAVGRDGGRISPGGGGIAPRTGLRIGQGTGAQAPRIDCGWPQLVAGPSEQAPHRVRHPRGGPLHEGVGTPLGARLGDQGCLHPSHRGESVDGDRFCGAHALHTRTPGAERGFGGRRRPAGALMPSMLAYPERSGAHRRSLEATDPAALEQAIGHWGRQQGIGNGALEQATGHWGRQLCIGVGKLPTPMGVFLPQCVSPGTSYGGPFCRNRPLKRARAPDPGAAPGPVPSGTAQPPRAQAQALRAMGRFHSDTRIRVGGCGAVPYSGSTFPAPPLFASVITLAK